MGFQKKHREFFEQLEQEYFDKELFVPAVGSESSQYMLVGEAPGANEVEQGEPFVGRAGRRLNEILEKIGVKREDLYITNLVKTRPPENRDPKKKEIEAWKPLLEKEIEKVDPKVIIPLGNFASKEMTGTNKGITKIHGDFRRRKGRKVMPVFHPAATLYDRTKTPKLEEDLKKAFGKQETGQQKLDF